MVKIVNSKPLDTSGIVNSPSRETISSAPIINPTAMPISVNEIIRSNVINAVYFDSSRDSFLYAK